MIKMEEEEKRKLRLHRKKVLDDVADPKPVLDGLISRGVLTTQSDEYQHILAGRFVREQTRRLLDLLPTLGAGAFFAFVESLASYRPHLAELLRQDLPTVEGASAKLPTVEVDSSDDDSDADLDRGPFPPSRPKDEFVSSLQQELRRSYINLGERKAAIVEFSQRKEGVGPGLDDICATLSSLNFDDVQAERELERGERLRSDYGTTDARSWRKELASKTFAHAPEVVIQLQNDLGRYLARTT